jgi:hypothetical protein
MKRGALEMKPSLAWVEYNRTYAFSVIHDISDLLDHYYPDVGFIKFCDENKAWERIPRMVKSGVLLGIVISTVKRMSNGTASGVILPGSSNCGSLLLSKIKSNEWKMPVVVYSGEVYPRKTCLPPAQVLSISVYEGPPKEVAERALRFIFNIVERVR